MSLGVRIAQKQRITLAQAGVSPIYGIMRDKQGMRPSGLNLQVIRNAGTSVHSVLVEGAGDLSGPWETLTTITDQLITKYTTKIPDYIRATATTSTGGTLDFLIEGVVSSGGGGAASNISLTTDTAPNQGTTTTVLHGNAAGQPSFGAVVQGDVTGGFTDLTNNQTIAGNKTLSGSTAFNNAADKAGQAAIISTSAGINTTETVIVQSAALAANRLAAGTVIRATLIGTCTSSAANGQNVQVHIGTNGTTADGTVFNVALPVAATTGTTIPFRIEIEMTVRTTGASATAVGTLTLINQGVTGISVTATQVIAATMTAFNSTTANNIVSATYLSNGIGTTCTFTQAYIEVVNK